MSDPHPAVAALAGLLGNWRGAGHGDYPTIAPFDYLEQVSFGHVGKPFLTYTQRTTTVDGSPLHAETGYLRVPAPGRVELVLAQPSGITEVDEGSFTAHAEGLHIEVTSRSIGLTSSAKDVFAVRRSLVLDGDTLSYTLLMAAVGQPLGHHLSATLHRT